MSTPLPTTVAIAYGLNEGPHMGTRLRRALQAAGYSVTNDIEAADVIIAHSGGCFVLTPRPEQYVIMIGLPYWPGRSLIGGLVRKVTGDIRTHRREGALGFWMHKTFWNLVYFWNIPNDIRMLRGRVRGAFCQHPRVTVIRYSQDPMCTPDLASLPFMHTPTLVRLPGQHDDCWLKPAPVVRVVQATISARK